MESKEVVNPFMLFTLLQWPNTSNSVSGNRWWKSFVWYPEPHPFPTCHSESKWYLATSSLIMPFFGDKWRYSWPAELHGRGLWKKEWELQRKKFIKRIKSLLLKDCGDTSCVCLDKTATPWYFVVWFLDTIVTPGSW